MADPNKFRSALPSDTSKEQQKELALYSKIDYQPFFRHYVQDVLRLNQDFTKELNEKGVDLPINLVVSADPELLRLLQKRPAEPPLSEPVEVRVEERTQEQRY